MGNVIEKSIRAKTKRELRHFCHEKTMFIRTLESYQFSIRKLSAITAPGAKYGLDNQYNIYRILCLQLSNNTANNNSFSIRMDSRLQDQTNNI